MVNKSSRMFFFIYITFIATLSLFCPWGGFLFTESDAILKGWVICLLNFNCVWMFMTELKVCIFFQLNWWEMPTSCLEGIALEFSSCKYVAESKVYTIYYLSIISCVFSCVELVCSSLGLECNNFFFFG